MRVILASASPRRRELLDQAGVIFDVHPVEVDETLEIDDLNHPDEAVKKLAERKAHAAVEELIAEGAKGDFAVLASDTVVALEGSVFGKPKDREHARQMLQMLSGKTHQVYTGVSIWLVHAGEGDDFGLVYRSFVEVTHVTFKPLDEAQIEEYLDTGEPFDKAGAYGIQGHAGAFVSHLNGSLDTVIGLPVERLLRDYSDIFLES